MADVVVDASILAKPYLGEEGSVDILEELTQITMWAPAFIRDELGNTIVRKLGATRPDTVIPTLRDEEALTIEHPARQRWAVRAGEIALTEGITFYDSAYLAIALEEKLPLWTADDEMRGIAQKLGVALYCPAWAEGK